MGLSSGKSSSKNKTPTVSQTTQSAASTPMPAPAVTTPVTDVVTPAVARDISADTTHAEYSHLAVPQPFHRIRSDQNLGALKLILQSDPSSMPRTQSPEAQSLPQPKAIVRNLFPSPRPGSIITPSL